MPKNLLEIDISLTKKEEVIMRLVWDARTPLSTSGIIAHGKLLGIDINLNSTQVMIKNLLDKRLIKVVGMSLVNTVYARTFVPTLTIDQFIALRLVKDINNGLGSKFSSVMDFLLEHEELDIVSLSLLEKIIAEHKARLIKEQEEQEMNEVGK